MPYRIPSTILFSESFPEWDHWGEVFHSNKTKCVSTLGIRQALASLYIMREGRRRRKRSESVPRGSFEFHALGCQAFRRGSGICQRPLTEDSSQLDKIHGPNFFFFFCFLCSLAFCWVLRFSNLSILTMEVPTLKIQDYPYFPINKRKAGFHKDS